MRSGIGKSQTVILVSCVQRVTITCKMKLLKITPRLILGILLSIIASLLNLYIPLLVRQFINLKRFI